MGYINLPSRGGAQSYPNFASFPPPSGTGVFAWDDSTNSLYYDEPSTGLWQTIAFGGGGEANTASNQGSSGIGLFIAKSGVDLEFKNLDSLTTAITLTNNVGNGTVDINLDPSSINVSSLGGLPVPIASGGTGAISAAAARTSLGITPVNIGAATDSHQATHQVGGSDELTGLLSANARVASKKNGTLVGTRRGVNFIEGSGVTLTVTDDVGNEEVDVQIDVATTPPTASYVTINAEPSLSNERQLTTSVPITLTDNGAGSTVVVGFQRPNEFWTFYDEFIFNTLVGWTSTTAGTGAGTSMTTGTSSNPSARVLTTGTTATGRCSLNVQTTAANNPILTGGGVIRMDWIVNVPVLSDVTNRFIVRVGMFDAITNVESINGVFFRYSDTEFSGRWSCVTRQASTETSADSGISVVANTFVRLTAVINAAGTSVEFFINGASVATTVTNIPGVSQPIGPAAQIVKVLGVTARTAIFDMVYVEQQLTTAR